MADYDAYDPRVDSLVVETRTYWAPEVQVLSAEDQAVISQAIHQNPALATKIAYDRTHTGFIRTITVTEADIERLYQHKVSLGAG